MARNALNCHGLPGVTLVRRWIRAGAVRRCTELLSCAVLLALVGAMAPQTARGQQPDTRAMVIVVGAAGAEEFAPQFRDWATQWQQAATAGGLRVQMIGLDPSDIAAKNADADLERERATDAADTTSAVNAREELQAALQSAGQTPLAEFWLVLIGHGSFDGQQSKLNLVGPDVSAEELAGWLEPLRPGHGLVVVNCASASGGFVPALSGERRVVLTATRSGSERNFARFGQYLASAIQPGGSDLDKDGQNSLLEAFLVASQQTAGFYRDGARLATEHALLDDNGDGRGIEADWFAGTRVVRRSRAGEQVDGRLAHSLFLQPPAAAANWDPARQARREELEAQIEQLVAEKNEMAADDYYRQLEALLVPLARLHETRQH